MPPEKSNRRGHRNVSIDSVYPGRYAIHGASSPVPRGARNTGGFETRPLQQTTEVTNGYRQDRSFHPPGRGSGQGHGRGNVRGGRDASGHGVGQVAAQPDSLRKDQAYRHEQSGAGARGPGGHHERRRGRAEDRPPAVRHVHPGRGRGPLRGREGGGGGRRQRGGGGKGGGAHRGGIRGYRACARPAGGRQAVGSADPSRRDELRGPHGPAGVAHQHFRVPVLGQGRRRAGFRRVRRYRGEHVLYPACAPGLYRAPLLSGERGSIGHGGALVLQQDPVRLAPADRQGAEGAVREPDGASLLYRRRLRRQGRLHGRGRGLRAVPEERAPGEDRDGLRRGADGGKPAPRLHHQGAHRGQAGRPDHGAPSRLYLRQRRLRRLQAHRLSLRRPGGRRRVQHAAPPERGAGGVHQQDPVRTHARARRPAGFLRHREPDGRGGQGAGHGPGGVSGRST